MRSTPHHPLKPAYFFGLRALTEVVVTGKTLAAGPFSSLL